MMQKKILSITKKGTSIHYIKKGPLLVRLAVPRGLGKMENGKHEIEKKEKREKNEAKTTVTPTVELEGGRTGAKITTQT